MYSANLLLDHERSKKGISQRKLSKGICSSQMLIKAVNTDANMEILTFEILLERIGRSPEKLEFILSEKEYNNILTRDKIAQAICKKDLPLAQNLLDEYINNSNKPSHALQMYYYRMKAWIFLCLCNYPEAQKYILMAISETLPRITMSNYRDYLFSSYEYENLILLAQILCESGKTAKATPILETIFSHAINTISDNLLLVSILPKCTYIMSTYCKDYISSDILINNCEYTIDLMRNEGVLYMLAPLMTNLIDIYRKNNISEKTSTMIPYRDAINELLNKYAPNFPQNCIFFRLRRSSYNLDTEIIHAERERLNLSKFELSEEVYADSNAISRLGINAHSPNKSKFNKLMDCLDVSKPRRGGFILTESFERLDFFVALRDAATKYDFKRIDTLISQNAPYSAQETEIINTIKCIAEAASQLLSPNKSNLPYASLPLLSNIKTYTRKPFLEEVYALITCLFFINDTNKELTLCTFKELHNAFEHSRINSQHTFSSYATTTMNYISFSGQELSFESIKELAEKCLSSSILSGNGSSLSGIFWSQIRAFNKRIAPQYSLYKNAALFANLYKEKTAEYINSVYNKRFPEQCE